MPHQEKVLSINAANIALAAPLFIPPPPTMQQAPREFQALPDDKIQDVSNFETKCKRQNLNSSNDVMSL